MGETYYRTFRGGTRAGEREGSRWITAEQGQDRGKKR